MWYASQVLGCEGKLLHDRVTSYDLVSLTDQGGLMAVQHTRGYLRGREVERCGMPARC